jgi:YidC/Oxa1 family membrane protein insertase
MDNRRLMLLLIFSFSLIMLWDAWHRQGQPVVASASVASASVPNVPNGAVGVVPSSTLPVAAIPGAAAVPVAGGHAVKVSTTTVVTDLFRVYISSQGGDIVRLELLRHPDTTDKTKSFVLFDQGDKHTYLGQSGLIGEGLPNHKTEWKLPVGSFKLQDGENSLTLRLESSGGKGAVAKTYIFKRGSYLIEVQHDNVPQASFVYYQITRDGRPVEEAGNALMMGASTYTGPAVFTALEKFQKVEFADIAKGKAKFAQKADNGWLAMVQHYFVTAFVPTGNVEREFFMRKIGDDLYSTGIIVPVGADGKSAMSLYAGPQDQDKLKAVAEGFDLVVDYGWLTLIAAPLFWVLSSIHKLIGNWGWSIIMLTVLIKLAFFPLSAASYKSMAKMRVLAPKLVKLKEAFGDDKQRLNQEMMDLYRKEKVNPLGGCLPVLVQIPVFIALYWTLLASVEMRNAPWLGWITDLSVKDPYYVLPLIMGATMLIQTKLNPAPPDPLQAKIMLFMPIMFTGMFLFFPAGLVLYWVVNNTLSIAQQWQINRMTDATVAK